MARWGATAARRPRPSGPQSHARLGPWLGGVTLLSAAAFVSLPMLAPQGAPAMFIAVTLLWTVTSSVLRAPPMNLIGRHAARPAQPAMVALAMLGLGPAAALAPWLTIVSGGPCTWFFVLPQDVVGKLRLGRVGERGLAWRISYPGLVAHGGFFDAADGLVVAHAQGPASFVMRYEDPSVDGAATLNDNPWIDFTARRPVLLVAPRSQVASQQGRSFAQRKRFQPAASVGVSCCGGTS